MPSPLLARPRRRSAIAITALLAGVLLAPVGATAAHAVHALPPEGDDAPAFDLAAHRGGIGLNVESTPQAFAYALELGVSSLELDVQITKDGHAVITHDRKTNTSVCAEGEPAFEGDPDYPYMGTYIKDLTLEQVRTFDCGSTTKDQYPGQVAHPGEPMMMLGEVFDLVKRYEAYDVDLNIETKVEAGAPEETAPREQFVQVVADEVRRSGLEEQVMIQSFDWGAIMRMREVYPELPISALTNGQDFLQEGEPGASPWLGGIDIDDFDGDVVAAVASFGADVLSPVHGDPQDGGIGDADYVPFTTAEMVESAHAAGIRVIPWTVNDTPTMSHLIDIGVDGIITDYPNLLHDELARRGYAMPPRYAQREVSAGSVAVTGDPRVGAVLAAELADWSTAGVEPTFQWLRDGEPIDGSTGAEHTVVDADLGSLLSVRVRLEVPGFAPLEATSDEIGPVEEEAAGPTPEPGPGPSPEPSPEPDPLPSPVPSPAPVPGESPDGGGRGGSGNAPDDDAPLAPTAGDAPHGLLTGGLAALIALAGAALVRAARRREA